MHKLILLIISLLFVTGASAQNRWLPPHPPRRAFHEREYHPHEKRHLKAHSNILTGNISLGSINDFPAAGLGVEYERFLDKKGLFSFTIPFTGYFGGSIALSEDDDRTKTGGFYVAPGVRFHPLGNEGRVDLGVGLAYALGQFNRRDDHMDEYTYAHTITHYSEPLSALLGQVSMQMSTRGPLIGLSLTAGPIFSSGGPTSRYKNGLEHLFFRFGLSLGGMW